MGLEASWREGGREENMIFEELRETATSACDMQGLSELSIYLSIYLSVSFFTDVYMCVCVYIIQGFGFRALRLQGFLGVSFTVNLISHCRQGGDTGSVSATALVSILMQPGLAGKTYALSPVVKIIA